MWPYASASTEKKAVAAKLSGLFIAIIANKAKNITQCQIKLPKARLML